LKQFPWCSPNTWQIIEDHYRKIKDPIIFEYGTGVSTLWHIRNLLSQGGSYIGVEHNAEWFNDVSNAIISYALREGITFQVNSQPAQMKDLINKPSNDIIIKLRVSQTIECNIQMKLRSPTVRKDVNDGTFEEFKDYVMAIDQQCDIIIVDGRARKACINYVLDNQYIKSGGLLVLFEAGRGKDGWLGWPALEGTSNYQPEVHRMLSLGGRLIDGIGVDRWPGLKRRTSSSTALTYPLEACFLKIVSA